MKYSFTIFLLINLLMPISGRSQDIHFTVPVNLAFPDNTSTTLNIQDQSVVYEDQVILKLPANYTQNGPPVRLVYMAHGAGGGVTADSWYLNNHALQDSLLKNGYAVFDVNGGASVENMGGSRVVQSAIKAYHYILQRYNIHPHIFVIGLSMGGCSSTNFVYKHSNIVLAHAMFSPVLDLKGQAWENPWMKTTRKAIATAFNFNDSSGNTFEEEKTRGWNPLQMNTFFNGQDTVKIYPVPVKIWHGTHDQTVTADASRKFHRYIQNAGGYSELREINSDNHGLSAGNPQMNKELLLFMKRFE